jgi:hypothetical protein
LNVLTHSSGADIYSNYIVVLIKLQWKQYEQRAINPSTFTRGRKYYIIVLKRNFSAHFKCD